jgi:hypothetical protein
MVGSTLISLRGLLTVSFILSLTSCSGGGEDGTLSSPSTPSQTIVSGSVQAPAGQVAFLRKSSLEELWVSEAYAALTGLSNVPDRTIVELARLDATATHFTVLATTTTSGGRYSFNLTRIGVQPAHDLIVRVAGLGGTELRGFVVGTVIDLSPVSEAAYRLAVQSLAGGPLSNLTLDEIADISGAVSLTAKFEHIGHATAVNQAVAIVRTAVDANVQVSAFVAAAGGPGQTTQGTGDVGNYFPLAQGNTWNYQGTRSDFPMTPPKHYVNAVSVNGPAVINGIPSIILTSSNSGGDHSSMEEYLAKHASHLVYVGNNDQDDQITPALIPYTALHFPLHVNSRFQQVNANGLSLDVDGDGTKETVDVVSTVSVLGFEDLAIPVGSFTNVAKVQTDTRLRVINGITISGTETVWLAPGVGIVKKHSTASSRGNTITFVEELDSYQVDSTIDPARPGIIVNTGVTRSVESMPGKASIASDGEKFFIAGCTTSGSNPGIFGVFVTSIGKVSSLFPLALGDCYEETVARPSVAFGNSNYFVAYDQRLPFGINQLIRGKRVSADGLILDESDGILISDDSTAERRGAAVAFDGTNYMVVWSERTSGDSKIHGARIAPNGQNLGVFPITSAVPGQQFRPRIAFDGSNYLVVWSQTNSVLTGEDIAGARVSPSGTVLDPGGFSIATTTLHERNYDLAFDGLNYLVVWESVEPLGGNLRNSRIRGTRISKAGTLLDGSASTGGIQINSTTYDKMNPSVPF